MDDFEEMADRIYKMRLHETLHDIEVHGNNNGNFTILRVAGGWIYTAWSDGVPRPVFVPFDNEFMKSNPTH